MNRSLPGFRLPISIQGFLQYKAAEALSPHTLQSYEQHLRDLLEHVGDLQIEYAVEHLGVPLVMVLVPLFRLVLLTRLRLRVVHSEDDQSPGRLLPILVLE